VGEINLRRQDACAGRSLRRVAISVTALPVEYGYWDPKGRKSLRNSVNALHECSQFDHALCRVRDTDGEGA
jgi:hypothetical protein